MLAVNAADAAGVYARRGGVDAPALAELSGLAPASPAIGGFWAINDSGNPPELVAIDGRAHVRARIRVDGASARDWEEIAAYDGPGGERVLVIGDIGDNLSLRASVALHFVAEPRLTDTQVRPLRSLRFTYADGPRDAESLAVDVAARRVLILEKRAHDAGLYALPLDAPDGAIAQRVATVPTLWPAQRQRLVLPLGAALARGAATSMCLAADGGLLAVLTYRHVLLFGSAGSWEQALQRPPLRVLPVPGPGLEALACGSEGSLWLSGEGEGASLWVLPARVVHAITRPHPEGPSR